MTAAEAPGVLVAAALAGSTLRSARSSLVLVEWQDPGDAGDTGGSGGSGRSSGRPRYIAPLHVHHEDDEAWYVLDGVLGLLLADREVTVPAGGAVLAPRGTPHTYWNAGRGPMRYLLVMTPRIQALIAALHTSADRDPDAVARIFREHRSEYLGWP